MAVQLLSQKDAEWARERVRACYLCGGNLPSRDSSEWASIVQAEHVVPKAMLRLWDVPDDAKWPIVLDVHGECDTKGKADNDQFAKIIHNLMAKDAVVPGGDFKRFAGRATLQRVDIGGGSIRPVVQGVRSVVRAVSTWRRGFHCTLYGQPVLESDHQMTQAPVPGFASLAKGSTARAVADYHKIRKAITSVLSAAQSMQRVDVVQAWGKQVTYRCVWAAGRTKLGLAADTCFWALDLPGLTEWAIEASGFDVPWHGQYESPIPVNASVVTYEELDKYERRQAFLRNLR